MSPLQSVTCPHCGGQIFHDGSVAGRTVSCPECKNSFHIPVDPRWHNDPKRTVIDHGIGMEFTLYGQAPVQAEGRVLGHPFYFRAKWDYRTFTVCVNCDANPACIDPSEDKPGFFEDGEYRGYYLSGEIEEASTL